MGPSEAGGDRLVIEHRPKAMTDPFTGAQLHAAEDWERYQAATPRPRTGPLQIDQIVLLIPSDQLEARIEVATLSSFIRSVEQIVERLATLHPVDAPVELAIELVLSPEQRPRKRLAFRGAREALMAPLTKELEALEAPATMRGEAPFRIDLTVHPVV